MTMKFKDKTRGGRECRIYATDGGGIYPIHGAVRVEEIWVTETWTARGENVWDERGGDDLLPIREPSEAAVEAAVAAVNGIIGVEPAVRAALRVAYAVDGIGGGE